MDDKRNILASAEAVVDKSSDIESDKNNKNSYRKPPSETTMVNGSARKQSIVSDKDDKDLHVEVVKIYDGFYQNNLKNEKQNGIFLKKLNDQDNSFDSDSDIFNTEDDNSDVISDLIGHYGLYQFIWTILLCLFQVPTTFHIFCMVFQAAPLSYWCKRPANLLSIAPELWMNFTQPIGEKCQTYSNIDFSELNATNFLDYFAKFDYSASDVKTCSAFEFDNSIIGTTIISEWNIICGQESMVSLVEMCFLAGAALGAVSSGWISDQFGRRHTLMSFAAMQTTIGTLLVFCQSLPIFMTLRFLIGFCSMAVTVVSFVLVIELVSGKYRTIIGIVNIIPVAISYILAAGIHYIAKDWRTMQLYITSPGYLLIFVWFFLPESPRWLLARGRIDELKVIIKRAASLNQRSLPSNYEKTLIPPEQDASQRIVSVMDLFKPGFKRTTLLMTIIWFSIILIYFGITLHMSNLGGNIYVNTVIAGGVETVAIILSILVVLKLGLRVNLIIYLLVAGSACLLINFAEDNLWLVLTLAMIVKCTIGAANAVIPIFTAFQYPTRMRNLGVGAGNFSAGLALICVPYLWLLEHIEMFLPMTIMGVFGVVGAIALLLLHDKLSKKSTVGDVTNVGNNFPREQQEHGLTNLAFTQNESVQL